jgi:hypothetical protein
MLFAGKCYRFPFLALSALMFLKVLKRDPGRVYRRELGMLSLLENNAKEFPCLRPILKTGPITLKSPVRGGWALAKSPVEFCARHRLLINESGRPWTLPELVDPETGLGFKGSSALGADRNRLDIGAAAHVFALQAGDVFEGRPGDLPHWKAALAAALLCHADDRKDECYRILDRLSDGWEPDAGEFPAPWAREAASRYDALRHPALDAHRSFVNVWFTALLKLARAKGTLPSSLWIWLKPTDRTLFYALNQLGGRAAWTEAAGVWSHYAAETRKGGTLKRVNVEAALKGLASSLRMEGWLPPEGEGPYGPYGFLREGTGGAGLQIDAAANWGRKLGPRGGRGGMCGMDGTDADDGTGGVGGYQGIMGSEEAGEGGGNSASAEAGLYGPGGTGVPRGPGGSGGSGGPGGSGGSGVLGGPGGSGGPRGPGGTEVPHGPGGSDGSGGPRGPGGSGAIGGTGRSGGAEARWELGLSWEKVGSGGKADDGGGKEPKARGHGRMGEAGAGAAGKGGRGREEGECFGGEGPCGVREELDRLEAEESAGRARNDGVPLQGAGEGGGLGGDVGAEAGRGVVRPVSFDDALGYEDHDPKPAWAAGAGEMDAECDHGNGKTDGNGKEKGRAVGGATGPVGGNGGHDGRFMPKIEFIQAELSRNVKEQLAKKCGK